jgi:apolipoprotein N-acyltransferase
MIQGSIDTILDLTKDEAEAQEKQIRADYRRLTMQATREQPDLDLIIWPESKFTVPDVRLPSDPQRLRRIRREVIEEVEKINAEFADVATTVITAAMSNSKKRFELLVGAEAVRLGENKFEHYNAALLLDPIGEVNDRYFKMHRVPFGEYVLFDEWMPWIYRFVPIPSALTPGERPIAFEVAGMRLTPSVCFESTVPHLIRHQINRLTREGTPPDVLVNITDDGWFLGSTCLDLHLACSIFRAVEHRLPMLVAANTGFSAWIDGNGRVLSQGPRRREAVVQAHVQADGRRTLYRHLGDWPAFICLIFCGVCGAVGIRSRRTGEQEHGI